jgi:hypothetical protein
MDEIEGYLAIDDQFVETIVGTVFGSENPSGKQRTAI